MLIRQVSRSHRRGASWHQGGLSEGSMLEFASLEKGTRAPRAQAGGRARAVVDPEVSMEVSGG